MRKTIIQIEQMLKELKEKKQLFIIKMDKKIEALEIKGDK